MPRLESSTSPRSYLKDCRSLLSWNSSHSGRRIALFKSILLRSVRIKLSKDEAAQLPLRVRPSFVLLNVLDLIILAFLGFHPRGQQWVFVNDKVLHFICFFIATALFYMIWDVDEQARRSWFWRNAALYLSFATCFAFGALGSEIVQSLLPYKTFQWGDVITNLFGSALGLVISFHVEAQYRLRREIERLYQPLDAEDYDDLADEDDADDLESAGASRPRAPSSGDPSKKGDKKTVHFGEIWSIDDEDEGDDEDSRDNRDATKSSPTALPASTTFDDQHASTSLPADDGGASNFWAQQERPR